jgi:hypothetical protein
MKAGGGVAAEGPVGATKGPASTDSAIAWLVSGFETSGVAAPVCVVAASVPSGADDSEGVVEATVDKASAAAG